MTAGLCRRPARHSPKLVRRKGLHKTLHQMDVNILLTGVKTRERGTRNEGEYPLIPLDFCPNMRQPLEFSVLFR